MGRLGSLSRYEEVAPTDTWTPRDVCGTPARGSRGIDGGNRRLEKGVEETEQVRVSHTTWGGVGGKGDREMSGGRVRGTDWGRIGGVGRGGRKDTYPLQFTSVRVRQTTLSLRR